MEREGPQETPEAGRDLPTLFFGNYVDRDDPAFENPTKPVGPYFTAYRANLLMQEHGWQMVEDAGRGWRKVVASPMPKRIIGCHLLKRLVENGAVLIAGGGAHRDPQAMADELKRVVYEELDYLEHFDPRTLREKRLKKYLDMGSFKEESP